MRTHGTTRSLAMRLTGSTRTRGFTLVELLAAIAIIGLLIGLLIPAVHRVRDQAKQASVRNLHSVLAKGCHAFNAEMGKYPVSQGFNPFESSQVPLSGAQWLVLQLAGADLKGLVKQSKDKYYDLGSPGIDSTDWLAWYDPEDDEYSNRRRFGPYVPLEGKATQTPDQLTDSLGPLPTAMTEGSSVFSNRHLPLAMDAYGLPVLYYVSNAQAKRPFTDWSYNPPAAGRFDSTDNWQITGTDNGGTQPGWDLGSGLLSGTNNQQLDIYHWFAWKGFSANDPQQLFDNTAAPGKGFAHSVYDASIYEQNPNKPNLWPRNPDTFLMVSPGKDAIYGSGDDIMNF